MMYAVNEKRNQGALARRRFNSPAALFIVSRSPAAARAVAALSGLGADFTTVTGSGDALADEDFRSYEAGMSSAIENGTAVFPNDFAAAIAADVAAYCRTFSDRCPGGVPDLSSRENQYAFDFNVALAQKRAAVVAGDICVQPGFFAQNPGLQLSPRAYAGCGYGAAPPAGGTTGGGSSTAYPVPSIAPAPTYPSTIQPVIQTPTGGGSASTVVDTPTQAVLRNLSRPNLPLQVGDMFSLDVLGPPNSNVMVIGSKNGAPGSQQSYGATDSGGRRSITGTMSPAEVGSWVEVIQVGAGSQPYRLQFNVSPAAATASGSQPSSNTGGTGGGGSTATDTTDTSKATVAVQASGSVPSWVWIAAAVAAGFFFMGGRR